ncbi:MAG: GTP cyclohydrolase FolE2 [Thermodesulfobacteriota bacterium]
METRFKEVLTEDVQGRSDTRGVALDKVGVCDLKLPLKLKGCERNSKRSQHVQAVIDMSVDLGPLQKGVHMSRLVETVLDHYDEISLNNMESFLSDICKRQGAYRSYAKIEFDYFFEREAPVSGKTSPQAYRCFYQGEYSKSGVEIIQGVEVPVKTLCPCSKEISDYGAHNQRSKVWITLTHSFPVKAQKIQISLEEIIEIAENGASSPLYPILKREDERFVTMSAYDKPCFVEDVVRNIAVQLKGDKRFDSYQLKVINYESIHSHNAFALIEKRRIDN